MGCFEHSPETALWRALPFLESTLPSIPPAELCAAYLRGYCKEGADCPRSHQICRVKSTEQGLGLFDLNETRERFNQLSLEPRYQGNLPFDEDGPDVESAVGEPRHDNDHADIRLIKILPTTDEILSTRPAYMPPKDLHESHFLENGSSRHIDTLFRHVRHDNVEMIIDMTYFAFQQLVDQNHSTTEHDYSCNVETPSRRRFFLFRDTKLLDVSFDKVEGITVRVGFNCPSDLVGRRLHFSNHFEEGMLLGLAGYDMDGFLSVTFFETLTRESTLPNGKQAAVVMRFADPRNEGEIRKILYYLKGLRKADFALIEYPKVLLAGYSSCLQALQAQHFNGDLPFEEYIAPQDCSPPRGLGPPTYTTEAGFRFNLSPLSDGYLNTDPKLSAEASFDVTPEGIEAARKYLRYNTTLDSGQASALMNSFQRSISFTQGPPGTGKSFLGLAMVKCLLASQIAQPAPPILIVCATNHALDQFLEDIVAQATKRIVRLGGGSKEAWTTKYSLKAINRDQKFTRVESLERRQRKSDVRFLFQVAYRWTSALSGSASNWHAVEQHVRRNYPSFYDQFAAMHVNREGRLHHTRAGEFDIASFGYHAWASGTDVTSLESLSEELATFFGEKLGDFFKETQTYIAEILRNLQKVCNDGQASFKGRASKGRNIWKMSLPDRAALVKKWDGEVGLEAIIDKTIEVNTRYHRATDAKKKTIIEKDKRVLADRQVIGLTTTQCAKYREVLATLGIKIVICEEAGEVLEAHTLNTLFPSVEHAIFIGDPKQLRPYVEEKSLSFDTAIGNRYKLDESLFERLAFPSDGRSVPLPLDMLNLQRRMHPDIADISRVTFYPSLLDHESTYNHPPVSGMADRLYWFDHREPEDGLGDSSRTDRSFSNAFETEMTAKLVEYLISRNTYKLNEIAVLSPYNGQVAALRQRLSKLCSVYLSEADRELLVAEKLLDPDQEPEDNKTPLSMRSMLRLSTVDNFQGNEAKVVIISTVRSNERRNVGFLKMENRINVAVRDGLYVIGNSDAMRGVPMWNRIITSFDSKGKLGDCFQARCERHPEPVSRLYRPEDFDNLQKCQVPCDQSLPCGHLCPERCHDEDLHDRIFCKQPCGKLHPDCQHPCRDVCGNPCKQCHMQIPVKLLCGHTLFQSCYLKQQDDKWGGEPECSIVLSTRMLSCGHEFKFRCSDWNASPRCKIQCGVQLSCGHLCTGACSDCSESGKHAECTSKCGKQQPCKVHTCQTRCHVGPCPPCELPCEKGCSHKSCTQPCSKVCFPCFKAKETLCPHVEAAEGVCCLPLIRLPCAELCPKVLDCGHLCTSLCGEPCGLCEECQSGMRPRYPKIYLDCGHSFNVLDIDRHIGFDHFLGITRATESSQPPVEVQLPLSQICPTCSVRFTSVQRYADYFKLESVSNVTERAMQCVMSVVTDLIRSAWQTKVEMHSSFDTFFEKIRPNPLSLESNRVLMVERLRPLLMIQNRMEDLKDKSAVPFDVHLSKLVQAVKYPGSLPVFIPTLGLRTELYFWQIKIGFLQEVTATSLHLEKLEDLSGRTAILAKAFLMDTNTQALDAFKMIKALAEQAHKSRCPILQFQFGILAWTSLLIARSTGSVASRKMNEELVAQHGKAIRMCNGIDIIGKRWRSLVHLVQNATKDSTRLPIFDIDFKTPTGSHVGSLALCANNHMYSTKLSVYCPDCDSRQKTTTRTTNNQATITKEFEAGLSVDAFHRHIAKQKSQMILRSGETQGWDLPADRRSFSDNVDKSKNKRCVDETADMIQEKMRVHDEPAGKSNYITRTIGQSKPDNKGTEKVGSPKGCRDIDDVQAFLKWM